MSRRPRTPAIIAALSFFLCSSELRPVVISNVAWSPAASTGDLNTASNWVDGIAPANDGTADLFFGDSDRTRLTLSASLAVNSLTVSSRHPYLFGSSSANAFTLGLLGGITVNGEDDGDGGYYRAKVEFAAGLPLQLLGSQTWSVNEGSSLSVSGAISGAGGSKLTFDGNTGNGVGDIWLSGNNTYAGGTDITGELDFTLGSNTAFGTGKITIQDSGVSFASAGGDFTLANDIDFHATGESTDFSFDGAKGALTLGGALTLFNELSLYLEGRSPLTLAGNIGESAGNHALVYGGAGNTVILSGTNTYTGGTYGNSGNLIFASAAAIPATGVLRANSYAYLGVGSTTFATSVQVDFIDRFQKDFTDGAIGFDTDPALGSPNNFTGAIDLSSLSTGTAFATNARLGSATRAILSGVITPQGTVYRFGMGGGVLEVASSLTGARSVVADSDYASGSGHLLVRLTGTNDYTGGTTAAASALIFATPSSLPATGDLTLGYLGYIGLQLPTASTDDATTIPAFLNRFGPPANTQGVVGFESADALTPRVITVPVDFTGLANFNNGSFFLGTSTNVTLAGTITMPFGYRFATYRGGQLTITSSLTGTDGVKLGAYGPLKDPLSGLFSTVTLSGDSNYSGITDLQGGRLVVGQSNAGIGTNPTTALGTSSLRANGYALDDGRSSIRLEVANANTLIANPVNLYQSDLELGGANSFTLSGSITGSYDNQLSKYGAGTVTVTGSNPFAGGVYIGEGTVTFTQDTSAGTGPLTFGLNGGTATFTSSAPSLGGLSGNGAVNLAPGSTLTLADFYDETGFGGTISGSGASLVLSAAYLTLTGTNSFDGGTTISSGILRLGDGGTTGSVLGDVTISNSGSSLFFNRADAVTFAGVISGDGYLRHLGSGTLTLTGTNTYTGGTILSNGSLPVISPTVLGTGPITLDGGRLDVSGGVTLANAIYNSNGGTLGGNGTLASFVSVGNNLHLTPGASIGTLTFSNGLALNDGGFLDFEVQSALGSAGTGYDTVSVSGGQLDLESLGTGGFTLRLISLNGGGSPGAVTDFSGASSHAWTLFSAAGGIGYFDPAKFTIDTTSFSNSLGVGGFFVSQSGNNLMLNFTAVPEPSTYALLALGLGLLGLTAWRQRRAS